MSSGTQRHSVVKNLQTLRRKMLPSSPGCEDAVCSYETSAYTRLHGVTCGNNVSRYCRHNIRRWPR